MVYDAASSGYFYHKIKNRIRSNLPVIKIRAVQRQSSKSSNCQMNSKMCMMNIQIKIIWQYRLINNFMYKADKFTY